MSKKGIKSDKMVDNISKYAKRVKQYIAELEENSQVMTLHALQSLKKILKIITKCIQVSFGHFREPVIKILKLIARLRENSSVEVYVDVLDLMMTHFVDVILACKNSWITLRLILRCCLFVMKSLPDEIVKDIAILHMQKIALIRRCLRIAGDFRNQRVVMLFFFQCARAMSKDELDQFALLIFPPNELCYLRRVFTSSCFPSLECKIRSALNEYNDLLLSREVISFPVSHVDLGELKCVPMQGETIWIDFNSDPMSLSIYCSSRFLTNNSQDRLTLIYIPVKTISGFVTYHNNFDEDLFIICRERFKIVDVESGDEDMFLNICDIKITFFMHERNRDDGMATLKKIERIVSQKNEDQTSLKFIKHNFGTMVNVEGAVTQRMVQNMNFEMTNQSFCNYSSMDIGGEESMQITPVELSPIPEEPAVENNSTFSTEKVLKAVEEIQEAVQKIKESYEEIEKTGEEIQQTPQKDSGQEEASFESSQENPPSLSYNGLPSPRSSSSSDNDCTEEPPKSPGESTGNCVSQKEPPQTNSERFTTNKHKSELTQRWMEEKTFDSLISGLSVQKTTVNSINSQKSASIENEDNDKMLSQLITQENPAPKCSSRERVSCVSNLDFSADNTLQTVPKSTKTRQRKKPLSFDTRISMLHGRRMLKMSSVPKNKAVKSTPSKINPSSQKPPEMEIKANSSQSSPELVQKKLFTKRLKNPRKSPAKKIVPDRAAKSAKTYTEFFSSSEDSVLDVTETIEDFLQRQKDDQEIVTNDDFDNIRNESIKALGSKPEDTVDENVNRESLKGVASMENSLKNVPREEIEVTSLQSNEEMLSRPRNCSVFEKEAIKKREALLKSSDKGTKKTTNDKASEDFVNLISQEDNIEDVSESNVKKITLASKENVQIEEAKEEENEMNIFQSSLNTSHMTFVGCPSPNSSGTFEDEPIHETSKMEEKPSKKPASVPKKTPKKRKTDQTLKVLEESSKNPVSLPKKTPVRRKTGEILKIPGESTKNSASVSKKTRKKRMTVDECSEKDVFDYASEDNVPDFGKVIDKLVQRDEEEKENIFESVDDATTAVNVKKRKLFNPQENIPNEEVGEIKDEPPKKKYRFFKSRNSTPSDIVIDSECSQTSEGRKPSAKLQKFQKNIWKINNKAKKVGSGRGRNTTTKEDGRNNVKNKGRSKKMSAPIVKRCLDFGTEAGLLVSKITPNRSSLICSTSATPFKSPA
ncbi:enolase-phosphatase E1-like [Phlebotomus papatasi]|uniref:enolase-phosphatase E1-like n=1 Tax=Phlebotomus papatasi TaxID=29031 RepID=UPI0024841D01|nr:enolase-phosphatase E1-like [Phlebotomus papatasi]